MIFIMKFFAIYFFAMGILSSPISPYGDRELQMWSKASFYMLCAIFSVLTIIAME